MSGYSLPRPMPPPAFLLRRPSPEKWRFWRERSQMLEAGMPWEQVKRTRTVEP